MSSKTKKHYENHENEWGIMVYDNSTGERLSGKRIADLLNGYFDEVKELQNAIQEMKQESRAWNE